MDSNVRFILDPYDLLDARTRGRLISEAGAPAGRYLSLEHEGETKLIALERPITHIGRGLVSDVRLEDSQVSRRHAILAVRGDGARLLDDRSYNGTFVNGRRVTVQHLTDGDVLRFGRAVFRFTEIVPPRRAEPLRRIPLARRARRSESPEAAA
jgi:pSer/pThr/pTyr-binding forkhead associated (FHA) protein